MKKCKKAYTPHRTTNCRIAAPRSWQIICLFTEITAICEESLWPAYSLNDLSAVAARHQGRDYNFVYKPV